MVHEFLNRALKSQNEIQILKCIDILIFHFQIPFRDVIQQLDNHGLSLFELATRYPEALSLYLKVTPEESRITTILQYRFQTTILSAALDKPSLLTVIIDELPSLHLFKLLNSEYKRTELWWHISAKYSQILSKILNKLSVEDKNTLLLKRNKYGQNVLDESMHNPESVELIFLHSSKIIISKLCRQKNGYNQTIFELALSYPNSFLIILKYIQSEDLVALLNQPRDGEFIFEKILQAPLILENTLRHLNRELRLIIITKFLSHIVKNHIHQKDIIKILLHQFDESQLYELLQIKVMGKPFIHHLMQNTETFKIVFESIPPEHRLETIIQFKLLDKLDKDPLTTLSILMRAIPQSDIYIFFTFMIRAHSRFIEAIFTNHEFLKQMILFIPHSTLWGILSYAKTGKDNFLQYLPVDDREILSQIIEIFPKSNRLTIISYQYKNDKTLLERAMYYPESLNALLTSISTEQKELIYNQPFVGNMLSQCCNFTSLMFFTSALPSHYHIPILRLKHQKFRDILHGFFKNPRQLIELMNQTDHQTLAWICEKIQFQYIYLQCIYSDPEIFIEFFRSLPKCLLTQGLLGLCYHYPNETISRNIRTLLLEYYHPNSPKSRRWFMDSYSDVNTSICNNVSSAKKYREWMEILEENIKVINEQSTHQLNSW